MDPRDKVLSTRSGARLGHGQDHKLRVSVPGRKGRRGVAGLPTPRARRLAPDVAGPSCSRTGSRLRDPSGRCSWGLLERTSRGSWMGSDEASSIHICNPRARPAGSCIEYQAFAPAGTNVAVRVMVVSAEDLRTSDGSPCPSTRDARCSGLAHPHASNGDALSSVREICPARQLAARQYTELTGIVNEVIVRERRATSNQRLS